MSEIEAPIEQHENQAMDEGFDSDDEFGEFGEFEEGEEQIDQSITNTHITPHNNVSASHDEIEKYHGAFQDNSQRIHSLLSTFLKIDNTENKTGDLESPKDHQFILDDRASKIFESLLSEDDEARGMFLWKQSVIYKQLLLNLDIPETKHTVTMKRESTSANTTTSTHTKDLYDFTEAKEEAEFIQNVKKQVPEFESLNLKKNTEEYQNVLEGTDTVLDESRLLLQVETGENIVEELNNSKQKLLMLLSVWDEQAKDIKADNELFTSYIENLIGNTQKLRRESRKTTSKRRK